MCLQGRIKLSCSVSTSLMICKTIGLLYLQMQNYRSQRLDGDFVPLAEVAPLISNHSRPKGAATQASTQSLESNGRWLEPAGLEVIDCDDVA